MYSGPMWLFPKAIAVHMLVLLKIVHGCQYGLQSIHLDNCSTVLIVICQSANGPTSVLLDLWISVQQFRLVTFVSSSEQVNKLPYRHILMFIITIE